MHVTRDAHAHASGDQSRSEPLSDRAGLDHVVAGGAKAADFTARIEQPMQVKRGGWD